MTPDFLAGNALLGAVGLALLHFVWQGALLALGLALLLRLLRSERAALRYALACGTLLLMAAAPPATFGGLYGGSSLATSPSVAVKPLLSADAPVDGARGSEAVVPTPAPAQKVSSSAFLREVPRPVGPFHALYTSFDVGRAAPYITLLWSLGVLLLALRLLGGAWVSARLGRKGKLAPGVYQQRLLELSRRLGLKRSVRLLQSSAVAVPVVAGWLRPVILLPTSALTGLSPLQLEMILAHELAHVRRRDPLVNALQHLVETALFYHPAVWWVSNVMREERENCCDDIATRLCGDPLAYAETLARLERLRSPGPLVLAASGGRLKTRIERLLGVRRAPVGSPLVTFGLALGLVGLLSVAGVMAQSGGATPDASPDATLALPERSLWVDILGDVTFTDDYSGIVDVGEDGLFVLEERRDGEPYRLIIVVNERGGPVQVSGKDMRADMGEGGGPLYVYAEGGTFGFGRRNGGTRNLVHLELQDKGFDVTRENGGTRNLAVLDADSILSGELNRLETDHPDVAQWLRGGLEQITPYFLEREEPSEVRTENRSSYQSSAVAYLATGGYYSIFETSSPQPSASLLPPSQTISDRELDLSGTLTFDLRGGLHYLAHGLITDSSAVAFVQDAIQNYAEHLDATSYGLMLRLAGALEADSAKADALVAVAGVLPEDAGLREAYMRVAGTIQDEVLRRRALDALTTQQGSTGLEEMPVLAEALFLQADAQPSDQSPEAQPLYEEARAYCTGEKRAEKGMFNTEFTMLTVQPDADTEFFIKPDYGLPVQTCVERFLTDPSFRERLKNPSYEDFLLGH